MSPSAAYDALVADGAIGDDAAQRAVLARLDALSGTLSAPQAKPGLVGRLFGAPKSAPGPRGLYIHGAVGRGKTMLMDLFFDALPAERKRRAHFHDFMRDVHRRIQERRAAVRAGTARGEDPFPPVAAAIAAEAPILCFDEFAVTDIADAMILGRLFDALFAAGVVVVATSNVAPADLYKDGLKRENVLPFIALIEARMDVVRLDARTDFRLEKLAGAPVWMAPLSAETARAMDAAWHRVVGTAEPGPVTLDVMGRAFVVPQAAMGAARLTFDDLVFKPHGAGDFLALAERFHTLFLDRVAPIPPDARDVAKRFITLIDVLYDHRVKLVATAAVAPEAIYPDGSGREAFEIARTVSRLVDMRSGDYLASAHLPRVEDRFVPVET